MRGWEREFLGTIGWSSSDDVRIFQLEPILSRIDRIGTHWKNLIGRVGDDPGGNPVRGEKENLGRRKDDAPLLPQPLRYASIVPALSMQKTGISVANGRISRRISEEPRGSRRTRVFSESATAATARMAVWTGFHRSKLVDQGNFSWNGRPTRQVGFLRPTCADELHPTGFLGIGYLEGPTR